MAETGGSGDIRNNPASGRSVAPLSETQTPEGRGGNALEEKINFDLSTLNMKRLVDRNAYKVFLD